MLIINTGTQRHEPDERSVNFMLSVMKGIEPRDEIEMMLAAQMAAVHLRGYRSEAGDVGMDQGYGTFRQASGMKWGLYAGNDSSRNDDPDT